METFGLIAALLCLVTVYGHSVDPVVYLHQFGYAKPGRSSASDLENAIESFQRFFHLPVTGKVDAATKAIMKMPRCGVPDVERGSSQGLRVRRYAESKHFWRSRTLTYFFENYSPDLGKAKTREVIERAFAMWNSVARIYFKELTTGTADIMIRFMAGDHNCKFPFDGPSGVLAHAFFPENGDAHFDEAENFTDGTEEGINLFFVAAHEFGHALGLPHSNVRGSLMYPTYFGYRANFTLPVDDVGAIQAIYGCKNEQMPVSYPQVSNPAKGLLLEQWDNLEGFKIVDLRPMTCRFPHAPDAVKVTEKSEITRDKAKRSGLRMRGFYTAGATGFHTFFIATSKEGELWLSHNEGLAGKTKIVESEWRTGESFTKKSPSSGPIYLEKGNTYYFEGLQTSRFDYSYFKIGVQTPGSNNIALLDTKNTKWMLTDKDIRVLLCNGRYESVTCPRGYQVEITKAIYGRQSQHSRFIYESCTQANFLQWKDCEAPDALLKTKAKCDGKQTCLLHASRDLYGAQCGLRFHSILDVTYRCVKTLGVKPKTNPPVTPYPESECRDHDDHAIYCLYHKEQGDCEEYPLLFKDRCPATCGFCKGKYPSLCMDDYKSGEGLKCSRWKSYGFCKPTSKANRKMRQYCRKTCGLCPE